MRWPSAEKLFPRSRRLEIGKDADREKAINWRQSEGTLRIGGQNAATSKLQPTKFERCRKSERRRDSFSEAQTSSIHSADEKPESRADQSETGLDQSYTSLRKERLKHADIFKERTDRYEKPAGRIAAGMGVCARAVARKGEGNDPRARCIGRRAPTDALASHR